MQNDGKKKVVKHSHWQLCGELQKGLTEGVRCLVTLRCTDSASWGLRTVSYKQWTIVVITTKATKAMNQRSRLTWWSLKETNWVWYLRQISGSKKLACWEFKEFGLKACRLVFFQWTWLFLGPNLLTEGVSAENSWPSESPLSPNLSGKELVGNVWRTPVEKVRLYECEREGDEKGCSHTDLQKKTRWHISKTHTKAVSHDGRQPLQTKWFIRGCT